jgi:hypothetical protein
MWDAPQDDPTHKVERLASWHPRVERQPRLFASKDDEADQRPAEHVLNRSKSRVQLIPLSWVEFEVANGRTWHQKSAHSSVLGPETPASNPGRLRRSSAPSFKLERKGGAQDAQVVIAYSRGSDFGGYTVK